ncbi:hypothetical protein V2A60_002859 [Cordyceps javanica]|uniref:Armadillo-like helical domain-containing protein n=1 Tax=Cordyceps javanica TaxID=43265 RepID=A0A545UX78_9HYPO|nr:hypothetical protein IF1G_06951 [Cordyceps javanica]TQW05946.1 hypothetical protein IF2G_06228 [Cordyceps javanica]
MEASPLTRQPQPEVFTPKISQLYYELFQGNEEGRQSKGFWREFFLLKPDLAILRKLLRDISPADMLLLEGQSQELFNEAIDALKSGRGGAPQNALDTLKVFLASVLAKRYAHPSSAIITILAGLDRIDPVFTDFVSTLEATIRTGDDLEKRHKAIGVLLATTAGAYQTTLLTYMIQRDLFPAVIKFIQDAQLPVMVLEPLILLSLLANYNKFEFQNPYQLRLNDFINEGAMTTIVDCIGMACQLLRTDYINVQEDLPEGWTFSNALGMLGLGAIAPGPKQEKKPIYDAETAKQMFTNLPKERAAMLLAAYDFSHANKLFCTSFVTATSEKGTERPMAAYLSLTSYLLQHAHLSHRSTYYAHLNLMVFRLLIEDQSICKILCGEESKMPVRLCRHRPPFLPLVKGERVLACSLLDTMIDGILLRVISYLSRSRTRLHYHWAEFFRSLLSLLRFLTTYTSDLKDLPHMDTLIDHVVNLLALSLSAGEAFLPTPAAYDDLFYKIVESGEILTKFKQNYGLGKQIGHSIDTLINVSTHYKQLLTESGGKKKPNNLTTTQVTDVIKQGYETLSIQAKEGLDSWDRYREADDRILLKNMTRTAVADVRELVGEE